MSNTPKELNPDGTIKRPRLKETTVTFTTGTSWKPCKHANGLYMTAKFWIFEKRYFVCYDCHTAYEERVFKFMKEMK